TVTNDVTAPTGQSVDLSGGPWYTTASVPLTLTDGADAGSGVDASSAVVQRSSATLSGGTCRTFGAWRPVTLAVVAATSDPSGTCCRYRASVSDNVGNGSAPSASSADAKVDTSAPTAPALTIAESSPVSSVTGSTLYYNPQGTNTAAFTVTAG